MLVVHIPMKYSNNKKVFLGDIVTVPVPGGTTKAQVVMLGETYEHLDIDKQFLSWVKESKVLKPDSIVIEWIGENPFAHNDARYASVGNYMFTVLDESVEHNA